MLKVSSRKELLTDLRNSVGRRLVVAEANVMYFRIKHKKAKGNTQEKVNFNGELQKNAKQVLDDKLFLKCIDEMLEK